MNPEETIERLEVSMRRLKPCRGTLHLGRAALVLSSALLLQTGTLAAEPSGPPAGSGALQTAVLAGGCFWGTQGVFEHVKGVRQVLAGYSGGEKATASYEMVSTGSTGHAESIQITFDPAVVSYADILQVFFSVAHDPTELNRQGPDQGRRYRSDIFYRDSSQQRIAQAYIAQLQRSGIFSQPIVTRLDALTGFYPAEDYQQDFVVHNTDYDYVVQNDLPRIADLKRLLPRLYRDPPVLSAASPSRRPVH
jgi:peptide-methionine (S)-S-oxide reductase